MAARHRASGGPREPKNVKERLRSLGKQIPPPDPALVDAMARARAHRVVARARWPVLVVVVVALVGAQWFRPVGQPTFHATRAATFSLSGSAPALPWPSGGESALSVLGATSLASSGATKPVPIAGLADVLTAYVIVRDHPLSPGEAGPALHVSPEVVAAYHSGTSAQDAEVPVKEGETLSERQALEGLLVGSGNDMATLLADWDAGSTGAFVAKMNAAARSLGLGSTHAADPSGLDVATVSTPANLIRLAEVAVAVPALAQMVALPQVSLPLAGTIYNLDANLGTHGFVGIKTGNDADGGDYLFEDRRRVDGVDLTLFGVVLGQNTATPTTSALDDADALVSSYFAHVRHELLVRSGTLVGRVAVPWGASIPVTVTASASIVAWAGLTVPYSIRVGTLASALRAGARVGNLTVVLGSQHLTLGLRAARGFKAPSALWRLLRL